MKILVCISHVPDTTSKINFVNNDSAFDTNGVQYVINPNDEFGLTRAIWFQEQQGAKVTVVNVGGTDTEATLRKALAIGADDAIRIDVTGDVDSFSIASEIAAVAKSGGYDVILLGKETINYNGSNLGGMLAELLDLPFVSYASKLDMAGNTANIEREIEGGSELLSVDVPFVISCAKGMAEARIPNMKGIMGAKTKPLNVVTPQGVGSLTSVVKYELPPAKGACKMISADQPEELIRLLHEEAKQI